MEQKRLLLAIVLSSLILFGWNYFVTEQQAPQQPPVDKTATTEQPDDSGPFVPKADDTEKKSGDSAATDDKGTDSPVLAVASDRMIQVNTPLFIVKISEQGGMFKSFRLKNFKETIDADSPLLDLISQGVNPGSLGLGFGDPAVTDWQRAVFTADTTADTVDVSSGPMDVAFKWVSPQGVTVEKRFTFLPDSYLIDLKVTIRNGGDTQLKEYFSLALTKQMPENKNRYGFEGPSALVGGKLRQTELKDIADEPLHTGKIGWTAVQDRYFMSTIIPAEPVETSFKLALDDSQFLESRYIQPVGAIEPGTQKSFGYHLFFGPKSLQLISQYGLDLKKAINFGWFDFIAKPCVWVMNFFYGIIPNYGIAIIIMTLLIKILLWPLGNKSYKSMAEMKKIQPLVTELREKHKGDKKKMNEEMMKLYRVYKVNPLGGCLPMALQIPVFFALYRMLYETIELRHAPFFGWITDLSAPDRLFRFNFSIPFMEAPYGIPVLTIIMGATMLLQQKMSPPPGDPTQAKMMMLMPIVFTVIFINFSSGLVLYWMVSNIVSISQQYYVSKKHA